MAPAHPARRLAWSAAPLWAPLLVACAARAPAPAADSDSDAQPARPAEEAPRARPLSDDVSPGALPGEGDEVEPDAGAADDEVELEFDHTLGGEDPIDPFGATPSEVVEQMLKLAGVGRKDIVYDLGSGDGRIPIAAARRGARGVGIELRPELVEDSRRAARAARVANRARFIQGDIFDADISEATVVMLYLYPRTNVALRPKLLTELRPGTRIVAFEYGIEGWPRDLEKPVVHPDYPDESDFLYLYVVPANASGVWQVSASLRSGSPVAFILDLEQTFQQVSGTAMVGDQEIALEDLAIRGATLSFTLSLPGADGDERLSFSGTVRADGLKGTVERPGAARARARAGTFNATRDPATVIPIDPSLRP